MTITQGTVSLAGAATGVNTTALIDSMANTISGQRTLLQNKVTQLGTLSTGFTTLNTKLSDIDAALKAIDTTDEFRSFTTTVPSDAPFALAAEGDAVSGNYSVQISQLAQSQVETLTLDSSSALLSTGIVYDNSSNAANIGNIGNYNTDTLFTSTNTAVFDTGVSGTYDFTVNGTTTSVSYDDTTTLSSLVSDINAVDGLSAYIIKTHDEDSDGDDLFSVVIQSEDTGLYQGGQRFSVLDTPDAGSAAATLTQTQAAQNAEVSIGGITTSSTSNSIESVDGLKLTLNSLPSDTATVYNVSVTLDQAAMEAKVQTFVTAYNSMVNFIATNSTTTSSGTNQTSVGLGIFVGESTPRLIQRSLANLIPVSYSSLGTDRDALSQMGIKTNKDGTLTLTSAQFRASLTNYQSSVESIFGSDANSFSTGMKNLLEVYVDPISGIIKKAKDGLSEETNRLNDSITRETKRINAYKARLQKQFSNLESITSSFNSTKAFLTSFFATKKSS